MSKTHNKKRNVGIIYEQLVRKVSEALVEGDMKRADLVLQVIKNNFSQDTELYKEFRLFNALAKSDITHTHTIIIHPPRTLARSA